MESDSEEVVHNNNTSDKRIQRINQSEELDAKYGFLRDTPYIYQASL